MTAVQHSLEWEVAVGEGSPSSSSLSSGSFTDASTNAEVEVSTLSGTCAGSPLKTLAGFDFDSQQSLDRNRVLALSQLDFIDRQDVVHRVFRI
jgi:hypothetical protein